jgi:pimeloyl-ACP methyl ester carboxylesterase
MPSVEVTAGTVEYEDTGGDRPVVVLLHGLAMDGRVWGPVLEQLNGEVRCVMPTLPFGAHRVALRDDADLSLRGLGRLVAEFLERADLDDVTLVFNDWGGAQVMVADGLMERVSRLVLTPCEAFENYPPGIPGRIAALSGRLPGGLSVMRMTLRVRPLRQLPFVYGRMSKRGVPGELMERWLEPLARPEIRRDLRKYVSDVRQGRRDMLAATGSLASFDKPVLVVWGPDDKMMRPAFGRRLADAFPDAQLVEVPDSYVLMPIDQPAALAAALREFVPAASGRPQPVSSSSPPATRS